MLKKCAQAGLAKCGLEVHYWTSSYRFSFQGWTGWWAIGVYGSGNSQCLFHAWLNKMAPANTLPSEVQLERPSTLHRESVVHDPMSTRSRIVDGSTVLRRCSVRGEMGSCTRWRGGVRGSRGITTGGRVCGGGLFTVGWYGVCGVHWGAKPGDEAVAGGGGQHGSRSGFRKRLMGRWCARLRLSEVCHGFLSIGVPWALMKISVL